MGRPNVGKSTLINTLLGQKVAAVSPRPQTTRKQQLGILSLDRAQIIFTDTPGVHQPRNKLGSLMNDEAAAALGDSDVILFVADASEAPQDEDCMLAEMIGELKGEIPVVMVLNKMDLLAEGDIQARVDLYQALLPEAHSLLISATTGGNLGALLEAIIARLPEGEPFYPEDQVTDLFEREIAADLIREAALIHLRDEVPHGIAVRIDEFKERGEKGAYIEATLFVERESQKGIVIGQGGGMLKTIGTAARREIEAMSGRKVFLRLRVKIKKNWRNDENFLRMFDFRKGAN
jgi:GTP-binding protein Era